MHYFFQIRNKTESRLKNTSSQRETHKLLNVQINSLASKATSTCSFNKEQPFTQLKVTNIAFSLETLGFQGA